MRFNLSKRTWVALQSKGWSPKNIKVPADYFETVDEVVARGWELFPHAEDFIEEFNGSELDGSIVFSLRSVEDGYEVIQNWAKKKQIKVFPVGGCDSTLLVADTGALYEADTDFEYMWKWGDSIEEGLENLLVTWKRSDETRISDGFGNIVDF
jgi:SUKH-3 immunity protein